MTDDVLTAEERELVDAYHESAKAAGHDDCSLIKIIDRLVAEVSRLSRPRTGYCPQCEALTRERDAHKAEAERWRQYREGQLDAAHAAGWHAALDEVDKERASDSAWRLIHVAALEGLRARYPREAT